MRIWFFDFDGTLSPHATNRGDAELHPGCKKMLKELSRSQNDTVAVISSRSIEDILPRVPFNNVIIGGNGGIEWQMPGGCRLSPGTNKESILQSRRQELMPWIEIVGRKPGIEIEDKLWSVAIHFNKAESSGTEKVTKSVIAWAERENIILHHGPDVIEIQLVHGFNKSVGAAFLAGLLKMDPQKDSIIYAGDDENDAVAMWWALMTGGKAIMVGSHLEVPGAIYVQDQQELVETVQMLRKKDNTTPTVKGSRKKLPIDK